MEEETGNPLQQSLMLLSKKAKESGLNEYLLIGGNAVISYGVPRFTRDLDFAIPERELPGWRKFLEECGFQFVHGTPAFAQFQDPEHHRPRVDLMIVGESTWSRLQEKSRFFALSPGISIPLVAPDHLIAMKLRACTSPHRRASAIDWSDIVELCIRNGFDPENNGDFAELVIHFGNKTLLAKLIHDIVERDSSRRE